MPSHFKHFCLALTKKTKGQWVIRALRKNNNKKTSSFPGLLPLDFPAGSCSNHIAPSAGQGKPIAVVMNCCHVEIAFSSRITKVKTTKQELNPAVLNLITSNPDLQHQACSPPSFGLARHSALICWCYHFPTPPLESAPNTEMCSVLKIASH